MRKRLPRKGARRGRSGWYGRVALRGLSSAAARSLPRVPLLHRHDRAEADVWTAGVGCPGAARTDAIATAIRIAAQERSAAHYAHRCGSYPRRGTGWVTYHATRAIRPVGVRMKPVQRPLPDIAGH